MQIEHKKNTAYYLPFPAVDSSTPASFKTGLSPVDTAYYKDGAGSWTSLAIADTASEIGSTDVYESDLTAAELNHDQVIIKFAVSGMADTAFLFQCNTADIDTINTQLGNSATVVSNIDSSGSITLKLGDDHTKTAGNAITITQADTGAVQHALFQAADSIKIGFRRDHPDGTASDIEGTIDAGDVTESGDVTTIIAEVTAAQIGSAATGAYFYDIQRTVSGEDHSMLTGSATVAADNASAG